MRKVILSLLSVALLFGAYGISGKFGGADASHDAVKATPTAPVFNKKEEVTVREYNGRVAIFEDGSDFPAKITDVFVITLPETDREMLSRGFRIAKDEISSVEEDFRA